MYRYASHLGGMDFIGFELLLDRIVSGFVVFTIYYALKVLTLYQGHTVAPATTTMLSDITIEIRLPTVLVG